MKEAIVSYMRPKIARYIRERAKDSELTVSSYVERLAEREMEREGEKEDDAIITREEIARRLEEADDPRNCISHESVDEFLKHFDELTSPLRKA